LLFDPSMSALFLSLRSRIFQILSFSPLLVNWSIEIEASIFVDKNAQTLFLLWVAMFH